MLLRSQIPLTVESGRSAPCCVLFSGFVRHSGRTPLHLAASEVSEPAKTIDLLLQPAAAAAGRFAMIASCSFLIICSGSCRPAQQCRFMRVRHYQREKSWSLLSFHVFSMLSTMFHDIMQKLLWQFEIGGVSYAYRYTNTCKYCGVCLYVACLRIHICYHMSGIASPT